MCGIAGVQRIEGVVGSEVIVGMRDEMITRGPDDAGVWFSSDGTVALGHRRLSILDPSPAGHQPMEYLDRYMSCYNGEIYNFAELRLTLQSAGYSFRSTSDTEVLLAAYDRWGPGCLEHLSGIFGISIYDQQEETLFLARDRVGVKPLYVYKSEKLLAFASRLRALLKCPDVPRDICPKALRYYLELGYVPGDMSIIRGVVKLEPGQWMLIATREGALATRTGRVAPTPALGAIPESPAAWIDTIDEAISSSVSRQMVSDVPIGAFLSGGIDSSLVAAMMQKHCGFPVKTFTVGFSDSAHDESTHAAAVAQHLGTAHEEVHFSPTELLKYLDGYVSGFDEPLADSSGLPTMAVCEVAGSHVRVCLGGDGGDELFGGYRYYGYLARLERILALPAPARRAMAAVIRRVGRPRHRSRLLAAAIESGRADRAFILMRTISKDLPLEQLLIDPHPSSSADLVHAEFERWRELPASEQATRFDMRYYLVDDILQKVDVASMAFSLEARVPLLDPEVMQWAMVLPPELKRRGGVTKWALRQVLYRYVPRELVDRPKQGFEVPIKQWFRNELRDYVQDALSPSRIKSFGFLRPEGVRTLLDAHLSGQKDTHPMLWALVCLLEWDQTIRQAA